MADVEGERVKPARARKPRAARAVRAEAESDTPDPIEIAMKAVATGADRHGAARAVLEKHACLIDIQCQREREEWHVLRVQRLTRWLILGAVAALLIALGSAVWNASRSSSLVIEPFGVPPALAERGLTGKVLSARVLDRLADLQRQTESMRGEKSYADNWQDDIAIDLPQTGVSMGEAWRTLKGWLGQETRIGGEVVQRGDGRLAITTRAGSLSGGTAEGPKGDIDRLVTEAARGIYKATQPYRYAISQPLDGSGEREAVLLALTGDPSAAERKWAYSGLSVVARERGDFRRARAMAQRALAIDPTLLPALGNLGLAAEGLGDDEAMLDAFDRHDTLQADGVSDEYDARVARLNHAASNAAAGHRRGDAGTVLASARTLSDAGASTFSDAILWGRGMAAMLTHDFASARAAGRALAADRDGAAAASGATLLDWVALGEAVDCRDAAVGRAAGWAYLAKSRGYFAGTLDPRNVEEALARSASADVAIAFGQIGLAREAAMLAARTPADCFDCVRAKGWAALAAGDRAGAARWFGEARRQGSSIPMAEADLGAVAFAAGDFAGAAARFEAAAAKGPRWADARKLWGDALLRQGQAAEAARRYAEAAERAPRWGGLHLAWAHALWKAGRPDDARPALGAAAGMEMSAADRARLGRMRAVANRRAI